MSIKTTKVKVLPLRGMDQRWFAKPNKAEIIEDMTWNTQDAWRQGGGWTRLTRDFTSGEIPSELTKIDDTVVVSSVTIEKPSLIPSLIPSNQFSLGSRSDTPPTTVFRPTPAPFITEPSSTVSGILTELEDIKLERDRGLLDGSRISNAYALHVVPKTLHWFAQYNGAIQFLIYEGTDGGLYKFYGSNAPIRPWRYLWHVDGRVFDGVARKRTMIDTEWEGTNFHTFAGRVYMVNGYDEPLVYDGRLVSRAGFGSIPPKLRVDMVDNKSGTEPFQDPAVGLGHYNTEASYSYRVSFLNERGQESPMSSPTNKIIENPSSEKIMLTLKIPLGPPGTVARRIYRTQNQRDIGGLQRDVAFGKEFYLLVEIQDNITTIFTDLREDTDLGSLNSEDQYGLWSSRFNRIATFKNTMFLANTFESRIRYSEPRQPEEIPIDNEINVGDSNAGEIVGMYSTKNALIVFKSRGIYLIKGNPVSGFFAQTLTKDVGCIASKSIREIPNLGLIFLAQDGFYMLKGALENTGTVTEIVRLGQPIEEIFSILNTSSAKSCRSVINHRDKEYWLAAPTQGEVTPCVLFKFHYEIGDWSISRDFKVNDIAVSEDHRNYVYIASSETSPLLKGLYVYSRAYTTKGQYNVNPKYITTHISPRSMYDHFEIVRINPMVIGYGDNDLEMNFHTNRDLATAYTSSLSRDQERVLEDQNAPKYGDATWDGTSVWWHLRPIPLRYDISTMHKGPVSEIQFQFTPTGSRVQLIGFELELRLGARKEFVALDSIFGGNITR